jgi:hypothetical protein
LMENPWGRIDCAPRKKVRAFQRNREAAIRFFHLDNRQPQLSVLGSTNLLLLHQEVVTIEFAIPDPSWPCGIATPATLLLQRKFIPQFRMSPQTFMAFGKQYPAVADFLQKEPRLVFQAPAESFVVVGILRMPRL